jgi:hypothetical protein
MTEALTAAFADIREAEVLSIATEMLESGADPMEILNACRDALDIIGRRF